MGQALYRKYRSKSLDDVIGQEHVTATLANALKSGRFSHAYLLSGPRGTGKTSIARILAHEINGLAYDDAAHLDIIEIDAASNRRIDEIRDLRDRVNTAPASAKYKVYIIDEVHMLTKEAFNALLKTLEEPPAHVVFILATTEVHKLPDTIISRTQRYTLRPVAQEKVVAHLKTIAKGEKITIDDDALELVAKHGEGSFRDSISLLDQASSVSEHITRSDVERILGLAPEEYLGRLAEAINSGDNMAIVTTLAELYGLGFEAAMIAQQLSSEVREDVLGGVSKDANASLRLLASLLDVPASRNPRQLLEIVLLQSALPAEPTTTPKPSTATAPQKTAKTPLKSAATEALSVARRSGDTDAPAEATRKTAEPDVLAPKPEQVQPEHVSATPDITDATELWHQGLEAIKKQYNTLYGIARMAQPELKDNKLTLTFKFAFHQKRLNEAKNRKLIGDVIQKLYGQPIDIVCVVAEVATPAAKPDVAAISNIFGGAELLES